MSNKDSTLARIQAAMLRGRTAETDVRKAEAVQAEAVQQASTIAEAAKMDLGNVGIGLKVEGSAILVVLRFGNGGPHCIILKDALSLAGWINKHLGPGVKAKEDKT